MDVSVIGAAAVWDYIFPVDQIPAAGQIARIRSSAITPFCGGGAPNIACSLACFGHAIQLVYPVGSDFAGSSCEAQWKAWGVDLTHLVKADTSSSGIAYLFVKGEDSLCFAYPGAADHAPPPGPIPLAPRVVIGPVLNAFTLPFLDLAIREKRQLILSGLVSPEIVNYLSQLQIFVVSWKEAGLICQFLDLTRFEQFADRMPNARLYITHGDAGSTLYHQGNQVQIPAIQPDRLIDPTGAGDAYTAGVVEGLLRGLDPVVSGYLGAAVASFTVESMGAQANLPNWEQVIDRLQSQVPQMASHIA